MQIGFGEAMETASSPCTKVCIIDPKSDRCAGCKRSLAEISAWPTMSLHAREALLADLKTRR